MAACEEHWTAIKLSSKGNLQTGLAAILFGIASFFVIPWLAIMLIALGVMFLAATWLRRVRWRNAYRSQNTYNGEMCTIFSPQGVRVEVPNGNSDLNWNVFTSFVETEHNYLLYASKNSFSIIPKQAFQHAADIDSVRSLLHEHIKTDEQ